MNFNEIFLNLGIFSATTGQFIMLGVGLVILFLAINKKFEPLLLLPIGFGAILTNIPEIGLALSPIEKLIYSGNSNELFEAISLVSLTEIDQLNSFLKSATHSQILLLNEYALEIGYKPGILNTFYQVAIGSGVAPLVIFMGAFSVIEASLPSSTSKIVPINSRGSSMGFFSTFQFLGTFAGGVIGGFILSSSSLSVIFLVCAIISGIWLMTTFIQMNYR